MEFRQFGTGTVRRFLMAGAFRAAVAAGSGLNEGSTCRSRSFNPEPAATVVAAVAAGSGLNEGSPCRSRSFNPEPAATVAAP